MYRTNTISLVNSTAVAPNGGTKKLNKDEEAVEEWMDTNQLGLIHGKLPVGLLHLVYFLFCLIAQRRFRGLGLGFRIWIRGWD